MQENNLPKTLKCSIHFPPGLLFPVQIMIITAHIISDTQRNLACVQLKYFQLAKSAPPKCGAHQQQCAKHVLPRKRCSCLQKSVGWLTTPKVSPCVWITHINMNIQHVY